jgi:N,N-dimethylformamidase
MVEIVGYADRMSVRPGETIAFKVSCESEVAHYHADIVRLRCGDDRPSGPGFSARTVQATVKGEYQGRKQPIGCGSYIVVPYKATLDELQSFTLALLIWPTLPGTGSQTIMGRWLGPIGAGSGYSLGLDENGAPVFSLGNAGRSWQLVGSAPLDPRRWYRLLASFDIASREAVLHYEALDRMWNRSAGETCTGQAALVPMPLASLDFVIGAHCMCVDKNERAMAGHFNGKIESPRLSASAVHPADLDRLLEAPRDFALTAAWQFEREIPTTKILDAGPHALHGRTINLPARGVTGHKWTGRCTSWREEPSAYAAIYFHEDDLYDCDWKTDFTWTVPTDLRSGIYAAHLRYGRAGEDYIPFFVLPASGAEKSPVAFLAASATYMAYANSHDAYEDPTAERAHGALLKLAPADLFLMRRRDFGLSTYDVHRDGSGCVYSSRLRPILNMRPKTNLWNFNADLHIVDWLEQIGQGYDVVDDETLEREGLALIAEYRCLITGTHPEYFSPVMLNALEAYLEQGGRLMYLGGNGFYWKIGWHRELPGVIEVRRGESGTRTWAGEPGESYLSTLEEPGGLWRSLGRAPQRLIGVGYASEGFDSGSYYVRLPRSHDPRAAFIFERIDEGPIGNFGAFGGAAALELDIVDEKLGTPSHALHLASSENHSNIYVLTPEEILTNYPGTDGIENPLVRADMVFFETPAGGAVFSTGSIAWAASLAHENYQNNVAHITGNVLRRFLDPRPFEIP